MVGKVRPSVNHPYLGSRNAKRNRNRNRNRILGLGLGLA